MGKIIEISSELEKSIVAFCVDELDYHINESYCAEEYADEIKAQIELLQLLGYTEEANDYEGQFDEYMQEYNDKVSKAKQGYTRVLDDDEIITSFIDDNLEDFAGFDCYEDTDGSGYRIAMDLMEEYMNSLSEEDKKQLADGLRKEPERYICIEQGIEKRG